MTTDGESVEVVWEDGHVSPYDKHWLLSRSFRSQSRDSYRDQIGTRDFKHKGPMFQISWSEESAHRLYLKNINMLRRFRRFQSKPKHLNMINYV